MRAIRKKLKKNLAGFSLAETLIAILILLMVSAIVAGAIPAASNVFTKTVDAANAQVVLSTAMTVLRDELSMATDVQKVDEYTITYKGPNGWSKLEFGVFPVPLAAGAEEAEERVLTGIRVTYGGKEVTEAVTNEGVTTYHTSVVFSSGDEGDDSQRYRFLLSEQTITENLKLVCGGINVVEPKEGKLVVFSDLQVLKKGRETEEPLAEHENFCVRPMS